MTKKEAWRRAKGYLYDALSGEEADEIIKTLEQESSGDSISRQAVLNEILILWNSNGDKDYCMESLRDFVTELPPVTPQQNTGHWLKSRDWYGNYHYTCPFCDHDIATKFDGTWTDNYCSNCGARLESENKE